MSGELRLNKTPFTERWEVVELADDGRTIKRRWTLHEDDAALLDERDALAAKVERVEALADEWIALGPTDTAWHHDSIGRAFRAALGDQS